MWGPSAVGQAHITFAATGSGQLVVKRPKSESTLRGRKEPTREMLVGQDRYALAQQIGDAREAAKLAREAASIAGRIVVDAESIDSASDHARALSRIEQRKSAEVLGGPVAVESAKGQDQFSGYSFRRSTSATADMLESMRRHEEAFTSASTEPSKLQRGVQSQKSLKT